MAVKTTCPITRQQFNSHAKPLEIAINGARMEAQPRTFSTGSLGWYLSGTTSITIDGKPVSVKIGLNLTIAGSKDVPKEKGPEPAEPHAPMPAGEPHEG